MSAPRRRTTYRVITSGILRKTSWYPEGVWIPSKETKATSKQDAMDKAGTKQRVHEEYPTQFPPVLKVVRRREERVVIAGRIPTWVVLKETEIDWKKEESEEWEKGRNPSTAKPTFEELKKSSWSTGTSKESYYLIFNKDEIFKNLIASEGHFRNFTELKEDKAGFLNCIVKHLADAEGHCDEAISHALIVENEETSRRFLELRDEIQSFRKWVQRSPVTRAEGIREIRKIRRSFEVFNPDYDVSKCDTCGNTAGVMEEMTKILKDLKKTPLEVAAHEPEADELISLEKGMAENLIATLSEKYGVEPPELVISDECHEPQAGLYQFKPYSKGKITVCKTGVNLHVLAHEFGHHLQMLNGKHMDEGEAEQFAVDLFAAHYQKGLYSIHNHSHNEVKMAKKIKEVAIMYSGIQAGKGVGMFLNWADIQRPEGLLGQSISLWGDILGAIGGILGGLYLRAPWDLIAVLMGGQLSTDLWRHVGAMIPTLPLATTPALVYTPPPTPPAVRAPPIVARGRYQVTV